MSQYCLIADMESIDQHGKTPLMFAVENELPENVKVLLEKEASDISFFTLYFSVI